MALNMEDHAGLKMLDLLESMILAKSHELEEYIGSYASQSLKNFFELLFRKSSTILIVEICPYLCLGFVNTAWMHRPLTRKEMCS